MTGTLLDVKDLRYALAESYLNAFVALQIRGLRTKKGWSQEELAKRAGLHQARISEIEKCKWCARGEPTIGTLRKVAEALGVRLRVSFETWSSAIDEICANIAIPLPCSFEDDPGFQAPAPSPITDAQQEKK